jgi:hypothetical protein
MIKDNPLIERIRKVRHQISEECNHDPRQLVEHYIELEKKHERRFVDFEEIYQEIPEHSGTSKEKKETAI